MKTELIGYKHEQREIYNKRFGIIFNGNDNLRPIEIENLIDASPTASQCAWIYSSFLSGGGFKNDYSEINLSPNFWQRKSPNDLLSEIAESISRHQGAFIHVGYNANFEKTTFNLIPYTLCRIGQKDSKGYSGKIVVSPKGWSRYVSKQHVDVFDVYNPRPDIISAQVEKCEGWEKYRGQVLFFKLNDKYTYPRSLIESACLHADAEYHIGVFQNVSTRRGFNNIIIVHHPPFKTNGDKIAFEKQMTELNQSENSSKMWSLENDFDDDRDRNRAFQFETLPNESKPGKFIYVEKSAANFIRKSYKNIPPQLVDYVEWKLGNTSGKDLIAAQAVYNALIASDKRKIELLFKELFTNYKEPIGDDWTINQYSLLDDGTIDKGGTGSQQVAAIDGV